MALKPWLLSRLIKDSEKLCSILTKRLVPAGPPFTPWVLLILSSSALTGFPHGLPQTGAERACPCPCARDFPTFWLRSSKFTCRDFTTALGSSSREGRCRAVAEVSPLSPPLPQMAWSCLVPWGGRCFWGPFSTSIPFPSRSVYAVFIHQSRQASLSFCPSQGHLQTETNSSKQFFN